jgi:hypothetical protein
MKHVRLSTVVLLDFGAALPTSQPTPISVMAAGRALLPDVWMEKPLNPHINLAQEEHQLLKAGSPTTTIVEGWLPIRLTAEQHGQPLIHQVLRPGVPHHTRLAGYVSTFPALSMG